MRVVARTDLFVVITDFDGYEQTRRCLAALRSSEYTQFTVIAVDHGITGETRDQLRAEYPEVIRIEASPDLWWTGATNCGIRHALDLGAKSIMLLNNDCYVTADAIGTLVRLSQDQPEAIIAPIQRDWRSGEIISISPRTLFLLGFAGLVGPRKLSAAMRSRELLAVKLISGGRGALIPNTAFARSGLFDEAHLPHYWADHDFYLRARKAGIHLYTATKAVVDIDNTRASLALDPASLGLSEFLESLRSVRSHRNLRDVRSLFRLHYPVKGLHMLGVALYAARYMVVYAVRRTLALLGMRPSGRITLR